MQARVILAILAVLMMVSVLLSTSATAMMLYMLGPVAGIILVILFIAICCGWRCGIYIFMGYASYNIHAIVAAGPVWKQPLSFTWYTLQILFETLSLILSCWVLGEIGCDLVMEDCTEIVSCKGCGGCDRKESKEKEKGVGWFGSSEPHDTDKHKKGKHDDDEAGGKGWFG